jgi:hypothetical protein
MAQQLYVQTVNDKENRRMPWVSIVVATAFVCMPPIAIWAMGRDQANHARPDAIYDVLWNSGIVFTGAFLFPLLTFGVLILALRGLRRSVTKSGKVVLWILFGFSLLNWGLVISFFSGHINK